MAVNNPNGELFIYSLNVGQADTSLIISPNGNLIVIDAVSPSKLVNLLGQIGLQANGEIEELVITHPHTDHYRGANRLLNDYQVKSVTMAPFWNQFGMGPPTYRAMLNKIEEEGAAIDFVSGYGRIYPDGALEAHDSEYVFDEDAFFLELLGPPNSLISQLQHDGKLDTNHLSIICSLKWRNFSMIFAGDAQMENWSYFDREGMLHSSCRILRSAHHGSCNGTQWERLNRLSPGCVIVSSDPERSHELPDLVGTSIFSKYEAQNSSSVVAITRETGSLRITVPSGNQYTIERFGETYNQNINLANPSLLTWENNPTNWRELLDERSQDLYHE